LVTANIQQTENYLPACMDRH